MASGSTELERQIQQLRGELAATQELLRVVQRRRRSAGMLWLSGFIVVALASFRADAQRPTQVPATPEAQMLDLVRRVTALERSRDTVTAPFRVVDAAGTPIFVVQAAEPRGAYVYNSSGASVISMTIPVGTAGGMVKAYSAGGDHEDSVGIAAVGAETGVRVRKGGTPRAELIVDSAGTPSVVVYNPGGSGIAALSELQGTGYLMLADASGTPVVDAGSSPGGVGRVRAGPAAIGAAGLGLPGSYIIGKR